MGLLKMLGDKSLPQYRFGNIICAGQYDNANLCTLIDIQTCDRDIVAIFVKQDGTFMAEALYSNGLPEPTINVTVKDPRILPNDVDAIITELSSEIDNS